jgi:hypothetical protein
MVFAKSRDHSSLLEVWESRPTPERVAGFSDVGTVVHHNLLSAEKTALL